MTNFNYTAAQYEARETFIQNELNRIAQAISRNAHAVLGDAAQRRLWNDWVAVAPVSVKKRYSAFRAARTALYMGQPVDDASIGFDA